jgi:hypothetical protein
MDVESTRNGDRRPCRGEVMVHDLSGGEMLRAELADVAKGGARLVLDRPLAQGKMVRLVFPGKNHVGQRSGRMIVGHVVHSRSESGRSVVGVAFGWDAAVSAGSRPNLPKVKSRSWFGLFSRKAKSSKSAFSDKR